MARECSEVYRIRSKGIRMVLMIGCILRGTHSAEQAISYVTTEKREFICYPHCNESIDKIFEYLGVTSIQEMSKCSTQEMDNLVDIVKSLDSNFTVDQFFKAFNLLLMKEDKKFPINL
ncbi:hypothetical protein B9Z55_021165 [Caenorhabditis nigoni]|uniref:Lin-15A/B-like domain-containing protein n=1 Tax=Caenorhabditis nigoni TaxID=1611254 RepID=A0A2G5TQS7_9PELO|nr:hypothetical protein B9Z55_021165 [Caenorhabditis nigoni]